MNDFREDGGMLRRELREDLPVDRDVAAFEVGDELAIGRAVQSSAGVDADVPELAIVALLPASIRERMFACLEHCFMGALHLRLASPHVSLRLLEERASLLKVNDSTFYARHILWLLPFRLSSPRS